MPRQYRLKFPTASLGPVQFTPMTPADEALVSDHGLIRAVTFWKDGTEIPGVVWAYVGDDFAGDDASFNAYLTRVLLQLGSLGELQSLATSDLICVVPTECLRELGQLADAKPGEWHVFDFELNRYGFAVRSQPCKFHINSLVNALCDAGEYVGRLARAKRNAQVRVFQGFLAGPRG